jgi:CRISPR-associated endonuclease Csn1
MLRGEPKKTRLDRRHHALDAIVLTAMRQSVAKVLIERNDLYQAARLSGNADTPRQFFGSTTGHTHFDLWLRQMERLADLTRNLVEQDRVPVIYPIRLRPQIGRMHDDTGRPLIKKQLGDSFSAQEIKRITDRHVYETLFRELDGKKNAPENPNRTAVDEHGNLLERDDLVTLFDGRCAMIRIGTSGFNLGTIHHARVYAWCKKDKIRFGMIRVFGGEFGRIGFRKPGVDLFQAELPTWSESWRLADRRVLEAIASGEAQYIGWLTDGDELDFGPITQMPGNNSSSFFDHYPETRWTVVGFESSTILNLRPLYLASEGLPKDAAPVVRTVVKDKSWRPVINDVCSVSTLRIIRRTAIGRPRWNPTTSPTPLPTSWAPLKKAKAVLHLGE